MNLHHWKRDGIQYEKGLALELTLCIHLYPTSFGFASMNTSTEVTPVDHPSFADARSPQPALASAAIRGVDRSFEGMDLQQAWFSMILQS